MIDLVVAGLRRIRCHLVVDLGIREDGVKQCKLNCKFEAVRNSNDG